MTEKEKAHTIWIVALAIVILLLLWLYARAHAAPAATTTGGDVVNPPAVLTGGDGQQTPVPLGQAFPQINTNFINSPNVTNQIAVDARQGFTNQATGYVPLFGFLGTGRHWL